MISVKVPTIFNNATVTIRRYAAGSYVDGLWVDGAVTEFPVQCSSQPLEENDYKYMPEGGEPVRGRKLFYNGGFQFGDANSVGGLKPDEALIDGVWYRLTGYDNWSGNGHTEAVFVEIR